MMNSTPDTKTSARPLMQPGPMVPSIARVREFRRETADTFTLDLDLPGYAFGAGQFNMLYAFGVGEAAISMSGDPGIVGTMKHTIRSVGSVTNALATLRPGDGIGVRGPFGTTWPVAAAHRCDVLLIAGGIGLAPLRPVLYALLRQRSAFEKVFLLYGARTPADCLYGDELDAWGRSGAFQVLRTVDKADSMWRGAVGVVTGLFPQVQFDPSRTIAMMCGPEAMMRFCVRELEGRGLAAERVYVSLERNMQCAIGFCGHCQLGPDFVCMDGPVFRYDRVRRFLLVPEA